MMTSEILYWKTNPDWFDYDENENPFLTEKATPEAKASFAKYLEAVAKQKETGVHTI